MGGRSVVGSISIMGVVICRILFLCEQQLMGHVHARPLAGAISIIGVAIYRIIFLYGEQLMQFIRSGKRYVVTDAIAWYIVL